MDINYNPDVLTCLANLSNDEVFTPPELVNQMLDGLPAELWLNKDARFLDPVTKSGVFLREMAKRLNVGLATQIPDAQTRINHIFTQQLFGIGITELTSLMARRSVYCSKVANGPLSVCTAFETAHGNIKYERVDHTWVAGKCSFCGASEEVYARGDVLETHAYLFIHMPDEEIEKGRQMKFDVIIGNPPYQLSDGGARASAKPLYHEFVNQAKKLNPTYLSMIIPSRWFSGGKGLEGFREDMLGDKQISTIVDYFDSNECFPGVDISGGVCYFLWSNRKVENCNVVTIRNSVKSTMSRELIEKGTDTFIRFNEAVAIFRKIKLNKKASFEKLVSARKPFGLATNVQLSQDKSNIKNIKTYSFNNDGYFSKKDIEVNQDWISKYKVFISYAYGERGSFPYLVLGKPFVGEAESCCSETYLVIGPFDTKSECENVISYIQTKFFRFLVLLRKNTQHATAKVYANVPMQDFTEFWTDEKLYKKYGLNEEEIAFIESMIRPMELAGE